MGFHFVTGIDNDKIAVDVAKKNAALNGIKNSAFFLTKNLEELDETFDLVVSNILFSTLNDLSSLILKKLKKNGSLIFSGILRSQVSDLTKTYLDMSQNKIYLKKISSQGDWVCLAHYGVSHQENKYKY